MDTLIKDGDFVVDVCGLPHEIRSIDEACQRVLFALSTKKGTFIYDREFGADFSPLKNCEDINKTARLLCNEALVSQKEISLGNVTATADESGIITLSVEVIFDNKSKTTEVTLSADL